MTLLSLDPTKERPEQKMEWEHASESIRIEVDGVSGHQRDQVSLFAKSHRAVELVTWALVRFCTFGV